RRRQAGRVEEIGPAVTIAGRSRPGNVLSSWEAGRMVVEVKVSGLAFDPRVKSHVVVLKEMDGERVLPIWIGTSEAQAIAREIAGHPFQRPLTHDLLPTLVARPKPKTTRL